MGKDKIGALCKKEFISSNNGFFTKGVLYSAEISKNSDGVRVIDNQGIDILLNKSIFNSHFKRQELTLPTEMDESDNEHWSEVMKLAQKYGFVVQAYGGTATLISRSVQLTELGLHEFLRIQAMNGIVRSSLGNPFNGKPRAADAECGDVE